MKTKLLLIVSLFLNCVASAGNIYYLQATADQWTNKPADKVITSSNTSALTSLQSGDEVWLTGGDYQFTASSVSGVTLRGGFKGTENAPDDRRGNVTTNFTNNVEQSGWNFDCVKFSAQTTVSGDVTVSNVIVSGFNNTGATPFTINGSSKDGAKLIGCWFYGNQTNKGAVVCSNVKISSCSFVSNHSKYSGGALYFNGEVNVENCFFYGNNEGVENVARDIYGDNAYKADRTVEGNLITTSYTAYGSSNTQYSHSASYISFSNTACTLLQDSNSPFIDKGAVSDSVAGKTIWGVNRYCDRIDVGCAEFQKPFAYSLGASVKKPTFIKEEGWSVSDTSFVIESGLDCFYMPSSTVSFVYGEGDAFDVRNWHFNEGGNKEVDYGWSKEYGDTVNYELDTYCFDTLFITATQVIDTFKLNVFAPLTDGVNSVSVELSDYNTSQDTTVYVGEEVKLKVDYDEEHFNFVGWYCENKKISGEKEFTYKVSTLNSFGVDVQNIAAYVLPEAMKVSYIVTPSDYGSVTTEPVDLSTVRYDETITFNLLENKGRQFKYWIDSTDVSVDTIFTKDFSMKVTHNHKFTAYMEDIKYNVNVQSSINGVKYSRPHKGLQSVTGDGQFVLNENTLLEAIPDLEHKFLGWKCPTLSLDTLKDNPYALNGIDRDYEFEACLTLQTFNVTATVEPTDWQVTITQTKDDGIYLAHDTTVITVSDTSRMDCWQIYSNGSWKKFAAACQKLVISDIKQDYKIRALYSSDIMLMNVSSESEDKGSAKTDGSLIKGSEVTVSAVAGEGYDFDYWQTPSGVLEEPAEFTFRITQDTTLTAYFKVKELDIHTTPYITNHEGLKADDYVKVVSDTTVLYDSTIVIKAECAAGFDIEGWIVDGYDTIRTDVLTLENVRSDMDVELYVRHRKLTVSATPEPLLSGFNVYQTNESGIYYYGDSLTVIADSSVYLTAWHVYNGEDWYGYKNRGRKDFTKLHIDSLTESLILRAYYNMDMRFVTFEVSNPEYATVECKCKNYDYFCLGDSCTARALVSVNPKGRFDKWTSNDSILSKENPLDLVVVGDSVIVANCYSIDSLIVCASSNDLKQGSATVTGNFTRGSEVEFSAVAEYGYEFAYWIDEAGTRLIYPATFKYTLIKDISFEAFFKKNQFSIATKAKISNHKTISASDYVTITAPESALYGDAVSLKAECAEGFEFIGWVDETNPYDTVSSNIYVITNVERNYDFTAVARHQTFTVTAKANPEEWPVRFSQTKERGVYYYGDTVEVSVSDTARMMYWEYDNDGIWEKYASKAYTINVDNIKRDFAFRARFYPVVSAEETYTDSGIKVWQPTASQVMVAMPESKVAYIELLNAAGQSLKRQNVQTAEAEIALPFEHGVYILKFTLFDGSVENVKVVRY